MTHYVIRAKGEQRWYYRPTEDGPEFGTNIRDARVVPEDVAAGLLRWLPIPVVADEVVPWWTGRRA